MSTSYSLRISASRRTNARSSSSSQIAMRSAALPTDHLLSGQTRRDRNRCGGKIDHEGGLGHAVAADAEVAVVGFHDLSGDGQPEAGAARLRGEERLEDPLPELGGDASTRVADRRPDESGSAALRANLHDAIGRRRFKRVLDQVREHLTEPKR